MDLEYSIKITCAGTSVLRYINKNRNNRVKIIRRSEDLNHNPPVGFNFENVLLYITNIIIIIENSDIDIDYYSKIGYLWNAFKNQILQPKADQWNWSATLHTSSYNDNNNR